MSLLFRPDIGPKCIEKCYKPGTVWKRAEDPQRVSTTARRVIAESSSRPFKPSGKVSGIVIVSGRLKPLLEVPFNLPCTRSVLPRSLRHALQT